MLSMYLWVEESGDELSRKYNHINADNADAAINQVLESNEKVRVVDVFQSVRTEDGYVLTVQGDGSLTDGDLTFDSLDQLAECVEFKPISLK